MSPQVGKQRNRSHPPALFCREPDSHSVAVLVGLPDHLGNLLVRELLANVHCVGVSGLAQARRVGVVADLIAGR